MGKLPHDGSLYEPKTRESIDIDMIRRLVI
jgi:hypothetical protein